MTKYSDDDKARGLDPDNLPDEAGAALHTDAIVSTGLDMSQGKETAQVWPPEGLMSETAQALNDAAQDLYGNGGPSRVQWSGDHFAAPLEVVDKAKLPKGAVEVEVPAQAATIATPAVVRDAGNPDQGTQVVAGSAAVGREGTTGESGAPAPAKSVTAPKKGTAKAAPAKASADK
jgi:hypothetical protein